MSDETTRSGEFDVAVDRSNAPDVTLRVAGEFDRVRVEEFESVASSAIGVVGADTTVVIDLRATRIIDSSALGSLVRLQRDLDTGDGALRVIIGREFQRRLFAVSGLGEHFDVEIVERRSVEDDDAPNDRRE